MFAWELPRDKAARIEEKADCGERGYTGSHAIRDSTEISLLWLKTFIVVYPANTLSNSTNRAT